ncbi:MAG: SH3 domain-containing protein [Proteobacteria bacterium]|nr:SH3 domain-containing protein [Pseudomonadota bacterium]
MNRPDLRLLLACCLALCSASLPAHARSGKSPATVVVQDAYVDLRSGPGRGFPATYSVERDATIVLLRQRTDWIKVRTAAGREGWVHRSQLERTLTPGGAAVQLAGPSPEARTGHHWEVGLGTGDFGGANVVSVNGAYALTSNLLVRADVNHLLGNYSNGWLGTAGIAHVFVPTWRVSPFVGIGGGVISISPKATLVQAEDRTDTTAYAGLGVRGFLTNRFLLQAEYRSYVVFTSRDENEEIDAWTVGFTYFF